MLDSKIINAAKTLSNFFTVTVNGFGDRSANSLISKENQKLARNSLYGAKGIEADRLAVVVGGKPGHTIAAARLRKTCMLPLSNRGRHNCD